MVISVWHQPVLGPSLKSVHVNESDLPDRAMASPSSLRSNRLTLVLVSAFLLRLVLFTQTSLPDLFTSRLEISTPITSFKRRWPPSKVGTDKQ